jgi:hypothetical protein
MFTLGSHGYGRQDKQNLEISWKNSLFKFSHHLKHELHPNYYWGHYIPIVVGGAILTMTCHWFHQLPTNGVFSNFQLCESDIFFVEKTHSTLKKTFCQDLSQKISK